MARRNQCEVQQELRKILRDAGVDVGKGDVFQQLLQGKLQVGNSRQIVRKVIVPKPKPKTKPKPKPASKPLGIQIADIDEELI